MLTGLDYWLDNLMCNVPELAMCFHLNGIVQVYSVCVCVCMCQHSSIHVPHPIHLQRYEMVKTEDIPNLENSQFSPKVHRILTNSPTVLL